jgi:hypothetical protein
LVKEAKHVYKLCKVKIGWKTTAQILYCEIQSHNEIAQKPSYFMLQQKHNGIVFSLSW